MIIIQISDLHLSSKNIKNSNIETMDFAPFLEAISNLEPSHEEKIILIISGDLTFDGSKDDCSIARSFLTKLTNLIKNKINSDLTTLVVPGNHDINLYQQNLNMDELIKIEKNPNLLDEHYSTKFNALKYFNKLCNDYGSFINKQSVDSFIVDDVGFLLVNSSIFSSDQYRDKEHHHLLKEEFDNETEKIRNARYKILVCHHRPDWFNYESSTYINTYIERTVDVCFFGHEHNEHYSKIESNNGTYCFISGGELKIKNKSKCEGSFNIVLLKNDEIETNIYTFERSINKFVPKNCKNKLCKNKGSGIFQITDSFKEENYTIHLDDGVIGNIEQLFVMPMMRGGNEIIEVDNIADFIKLLETENKIVISGSSLIGKSAFIFNLMNEIRNERIPIYINGECSNNNFNKMIKCAFEDMYGCSPELYKYFLSLPPTQKILFIDNFDELSQSSRKQFLDEADKMFKKIVVTSKNDFANLLDHITVNNNPFVELKIKGLFLKQRIELIRKIARCFCIQDEDTINGIIKTFNLSSQMSSIIDITNPAIVTQLTEKIISSKLYLKKEVSDAYNIVFEFTINQALANGGNNELIESCTGVLQRLAFDVCTGKDNVYFSEDDMLLSFSNAKKDFGSISESTTDLITYVIKSGIIKRVDKDKYKFHHNTYLAFFAAKEIVFRYKNGDDEIVSNLCDNITSGINSDIFLFVVYQLKETKVFMKIKTKLENALEQYPELNFNNKNNVLIRRKKEFVPETKEQAENRQQFVDRLSNTEKKKLVNIESTEEANFSRKDDFQNIFYNNIVKVFKYIEILCKSVAGFHLEINNKTRTELINFIPSAIFKLLYLLFDIDETMAKELEVYFNNRRDERVNELEKNQPNSILIQKWKEFSFEDYMYDFITTTILNIMHSFASLMCSRASEPLFCILQNEENKFLYSLLRLMLFEAYGKNTKFIDTVSEIVSYGRNDFNHLIARVIRIAIIKNNFKSSEIDRLSSITKINKEKLLSYQFLYKK